MWYDNGHHYEHCFYKEDKLDGEYKKWYVDGQIYKHDFYKDGEVMIIKTFSL